MHAFDLLAVGEVMLDVVGPPLAVRAGGSPVTAAAAVTALGGRAAVVGRIGDDAAGRAVSDELRRAGVDQLLAVDPSAPTGTFASLGEPPSILVNRGANALLAKVDLPERIDAAATLVSGYTLLHEDTRPAAIEALARARGSWIGVDAASARLLERVGTATFLELTGPASVLLANESEAHVLTGTGGESAALELARNYAIACVKLGALGAVAARDGALVSVRPHGTTPALGDGDAFAGGLLFGLARGEELATALRTASEAAAAV